MLMYVYLYLYLQVLFFNLKWRYVRETNNIVIWVRILPLHSIKNDLE